MQSRDEALDDELGRRSNRDTWRMTSGFRYFSAVPAKRSLRGSVISNEPERAIVRGQAGSKKCGFGSCCSGCCCGCPDLPSTSLLFPLVLGSLGLADLAQEPFHEALGGLPLGLGLKVGADAVA